MNYVSCDEYDLDHDLGLHVQEQHSLGVRGG